MYIYNLMCIYPHKASNQKRLGLKSNLLTYYCRHSLLSHSFSKKFLEATYNQRPRQVKGCRRDHNKVRKVIICRWSPSFCGGFRKPGNLPPSFCSCWHRSSFRPSARLLAVPQTHSACNSFPPGSCEAFQNNPVSGQIPCLRRSSLAPVPTRDQAPRCFSLTPSLSFKILSVSQHYYSMCLSIN